MATKTVSFNFVKKVKFKLGKDSQSKIFGKKKILGLQAFSFSGGQSFHLIPVKVVKNDLTIKRSGKDVEIEGLLKVKLNVSDKFLPTFNENLKKKAFEVNHIGFNTDEVPGLELCMFDFPNPKKTSDSVEIN